MIVIIIKTSGFFREEAMPFLKEVGHCIILKTQDPESLLNSVSGYYILLGVPVCISDYNKYDI